MVFKAIGQTLATDARRLAGARAARTAASSVDGERRTSLAGVWAGGDCVAGGQDLTVVAVEDGKLAALAIDRALHRRQLEASERSMADLTRSTFCGIKSPNPFWLASAPPTNKAYKVMRAFDAGWGGAVWKTLGEDPPIVNVSSALRRAGTGTDRRMLGFNNIELITDRPLEVNLREITQVKRDWPEHA